MKLIDADVLLDKTVRRNSAWNSITNSEGKNLEEIVSEMPPKDRSVQDFVDKCRECGKQKTGHWIDDEFGSKCSCCGIHTHLDKFDRPMKFKYCSMCGAKMVESQESEEKS